jgi:hypothetical protein
MEYNDPVMAPEDLQRIGDVLIEEGVLTHEDVVRLVSEGGLKGTALAALLEQARHVRRADLAAFLAGDFRVPKIEDLRKFDLYDEAAKVVPEALARKHEMVPIAKLGDVLCVARPTYFNKAAVQDLRKATGLRVKVFQADEDQVLAAIERIYGKRHVEIPPPKGAAADTRAQRAQAPPVREEAADEAIPLIALPSDQAADMGVGAPQLQEIVLEPAPPGGVHDVMDAVRINPSEFAEEEKRSGSRWIHEFEQTFLTDQPLDPIRMA